MIFRVDIYKSFEVSEDEILRRMKKIKSSPKPTFEEVAAEIARERFITFLDVHSAWTHRGIVPEGEPFSDGKKYEGVKHRVELVKEENKNIPF